MTGELQLCKLVFFGHQTAGYINMYSVVHQDVSIPCLSYAAGPEVSVEGSLWHLQNLG